MATVLEFTTEEQRSVVLFLWARGLNAKDIHKEMFPVYGGMCLSFKMVHIWVEKRDKRFANDEEVETEVRKWLRQQLKDFCCGFRRIGKAMKRISAGGGYVQKYVFFLGPNSTYFIRFISVTYLLTLVYEMKVYCRFEVSCSGFERYLRQVSAIIKSSAISLSSKQVIMPYKAPTASYPFRFLSYDNWRVSSATNFIEQSVL
jgi:hypothetical protein